MDKKVILAIVAVVLIGAVGFFLMNAKKETTGDKIAGSVSEVVDSAGEGAAEMKEEIKDEIDDNTTDAH